MMKFMQEISVPERKIENLHLVSNDEETQHTTIARMIKSASVDVISPSSHFYRCDIRILCKSVHI
jgi:hypothetical protein